MDKLQKLIDFYPKKYLFSNYILSIFLTLMFFFQFIPNNVHPDDISMKICLTILFIINGLIYPYSKGLFFNPGKLSDENIGDSFFSTIGTLYFAFGIQLAICWTFGFVLGIIKIIIILVSNEDKCHWYDDYRFFSNFRNVLARK